MNVSLRAPFELLRAEPDAEAPSLEIVQRRDARERRTGLDVADAIAGPINGVAATIVDELERARLRMAQRAGALLTPPVGGVRDGADGDGGGCGCWRGHLTHSPSPSCTSAHMETASSKAGNTEPSSPHIS